MIIDWAEMKNSMFRHSLLSENRPQFNLSQHPRLISESGNFNCIGLNGTYSHKYHLVPSFFNLSLDQENCIFKERNGMLERHANRGHTSQTPQSLVSSGTLKADGS